MARQRDYDSLARLKKQKKELEKRIGELDNKIKTKTNAILLNNPSKDVTTKYGILNLRKQNTYIIPDNEELMNVANISQKVFNKIAKVNSGDLKKLCTKEVFNQLLFAQVIQIKSTAEFYKFTEFPSKNQEQL